MKLFALMLASVASFLLSPGVQAQETAPDVLVKNVTNEVLDIIRKDKDIKAGSTKRAIELVDHKVLPHFNFSRMTALAVGRDWRQATPEQQKALTGGFPRPAGAHLFECADQPTRTRPSITGPSRCRPGETDVTVRTQIHQPGARQPITLDYSLEKNGSAWKVYDVVVAGVSLVTNYRSSFATEIRNGGIDGLIKTLKAKNKSLEAASKK
jgi:phospholipid transport system substrate-binding protein